MNEIYWITRLDMINGWLFAFCIVSGIILTASTIMYMVGKNCDYDDSDSTMKTFTAIIKPSAWVFFTTLPLTILTPTKDEAMLIWGVGSTIDYLQDSETVQQLPDKVVNALDAWVESLSNDKEGIK